MNIAIFASAFHPHVGGVEELVRQLGRHLLAEGHRVVILTNRWPRTLPEADEVDGMPVYRVAFRVPDGSAKAHLSHWLTSARLHRQTSEILRSHQVDLLHVQCVSSNAHYALAAARDGGWPLIVTTQGERTMDAQRIFQRSPFINQVMRAALAQAVHVTACSQYSLDDLTAHYGMDLGGRSSVIYNGVSVQDFASLVPYNHARPYILGIGRFVPQKGFDVLIQAFEQANLAGHDLLLAGLGPEEATLRATSTSGRVHFVGRADRSMVGSLFGGATAFVLPSRLEPQGIVNLEAMAAGCPVVASAVGGVPEIVEDGVCGLLVPPEDGAALAASLQRIVGDAGLRQRLVAEGRRRALEFDWPRVTRRYLDVYHQALQAGT